MSESDYKAIYKRPYNRPDRNWVCGNAAQGKPCPRGPLPSGACPGHYACEPQKVGDRYLCTRPDQYGGPCNGPNSPDKSFGPISQNGKVVCCQPMHCQPVRSLRARRSRVVYMLCLAIAGLFLAALGSRYRNAVISPGPLTAFHEGASYGAQMLSDADQSRSGANNCNLCHTALSEGVGSFFDTSHKQWQSQSQQCLDCHQDLAVEPLHAHGVDPEELRRRTEAVSGEPFSAFKGVSLQLATMAPGINHAPAAEMACATCHHEHNGRLFDLTAMDNASCQVCHTRQFDSFNGGHPDFAAKAAGDAYDYPFRRRTRIIYDHESHDTKHFLGGELAQFAPQDCTSCHEVTDTPFATRLRPFEQMCGQCHLGKDITVDKQGDWISLLGFPTVDLLTLEDNDIVVEDWPEAGDRPLSPFMAFFLQGIEAEGLAQYEADLTVAADQLDLDLSENGFLPDLESEEEFKSVERMMTGTQALLASLEAEPSEPVLAGIVTKALGYRPSPEALTAMLGGLAAPKAASTIFSEVDRTDVVSSFGWLSREDGRNLSPRQWENKVKAQPEYAALFAAPAPSPVEEEEAAKEEETGDGEEASVAEESAASAAPPTAGLGESLKEFSQWFEDRDAFQPWFNGRVRVADGRWYGRGSAGGLRDSDWVAALESVPVYAAFKDQVKNHGGETAQAFISWFESMNKVQSWLDEDLRIAEAGWYAADSPRSLMYRPVGHADPFLKAWLDATAEIYPANKGARVLFDYLSGKKARSAAPGNCTKCHSVDVFTDVHQGNHVKVNWMGKEKEKRFTRFNHLPHLKLMECTVCHPTPWMEENPTGETTGLKYLDGFLAMDDGGSRGSELGVNFVNHPASPHPAFVSSFPGIDKQTCSQCHTRAEAGNNCTLCHNYHISTIMPGGGVFSLNEIIESITTPAEAAPAEDGPAEDAPEDAIAADAE